MCILTFVQQTRQKKLLSHLQDVLHFETRWFGTLTAALKKDATTGTTLFPNIFCDQKASVNLKAGGGQPLVELVLPLNPPTEEIDLHKDESIRQLLKVCVQDTLLPFINLSLKLFFSRLYLTALLLTTSARSASTLGPKSCW